ncbi:Vegetative incompatibility protein HET-E-1 [Trichoderma guizhouense]|uniref:Vegetative incompatibility protein HET-E-1 n=1 Tax=Trichoderma guizhouense TaxID=1491466 RepID=A0A1T3CFG5_9HYPO|nr:Vegetative incompatibility protein HET-E-1 [Trichoderma guizhouense]
MRQLIYDGLNKTAKEARVKEVIGIAISTKDIITNAVQAAPQAALAWTGMMQNPIAATKANRDGIEYVIKRMNMYWELSGVALKDNANDGLSGIRGELEAQIINLYKVLLTYEIKSVCSYYRNRGSVLLRDIISLDDWNGDIQAIKAAERVFHDDFATFARLETASDIKQLVTHVKEQSTAQITKEDQQCIRDLRLSDPSDDKKRIEQTKGGLLQESYTWVLGNLEYQQWLDSEDSRLLWIKGDPGKGKTMLLCGIINELSSRPGHCVCYFFCQATDQQLNNASAALRGLIFMLAKQQPSLISHIRKKYDEAGKKLFEGLNTWITLSDIFTAILQDPTLKSTYLIIDAIDECVSDFEKLLDLIVHATGINDGVKWIVSSRNWPKIEERLRLAEQKVKLSLELNAESISSAVNFYIEKKVHQLSDLKGYDEKTYSEIRSYLFKNANDTFLWVALVCQNLAKYPRWKVLKMLSTFPPGLDSLYERMIEQMTTINDSIDSIAGSDSSDISLCKQILAVMMSVYRPITLQELGCLIEIPEELSADIEFLREIVALCGSFLTIREDIVYFIHQSAKDHLSKNDHVLFPLSLKDTHHNIFSRSLRAMNKNLRKNIYDLKDPAYLTGNGISMPHAGPDPLSPIRYSCVHWVDHLRDKNALGRDDLGDDGIVSSFLRKHLLHWFEALSLIQHVSAGVVSIAMLETILTIQFPTGEILSLLRDAHRFILHNRRTIEIAPLQTYSSALIFSPMKSLIRQAFHQEIPSWIQEEPIVEENWSPCLQTLEGHTAWVTSVAFSADHKHIASGSKDNTVKIWDAVTGVCLQTFEGHTDWVTSVIFLPNSEKVVSGSVDETIKIWNAATGNCDASLEGHTGAVQSVAVLSDNQIVSVSHDQTIKIWDILTRACIMTLKGHDEYITSVATGTFANGNIATGSGDATIKIWDSSTGACVQTLKGHIAWICSVAFLNSQQVISGSDDETIKVWDIVTGECVQTLRHTDSIWSLAIVAPGHVASASDDMINIWDVATGACIQTLQGHTDHIKSIATISPDQIVSGSHDGTIKIWDLAIGTSEKSFDSNSRLVQSTALSLDGRQMASGLTDDRIKVWDVETGACVQTLEGHSDFVTSIVFLKHGQIASASWDGMVKVWQVDTGACVQTLKAYNGAVYSIASSANSKYIALGLKKRVEIWNVVKGKCSWILEDTGFVSSLAFSMDAQQLVLGSSTFENTGKITIWNIATEKCTRTLEGHDSEILSIAFSSDGRYVASASADSTVKVWDVADVADVADAAEESLWTFDVGMVHRLSFDPAVNHIIYSDIGIINLDLDQDQDQDRDQDREWDQDSKSVATRGYGLNRSHDWITKDGRPLLWLPVPYRSYTSVVVESSIILCKSGRILKIKFLDP